MFSPLVTAAHAHQLEAHYKRDLKPHTTAEIEDFTARLHGAMNAKGEVRALTVEEQDFIENELLLTKVDFAYFANNYCLILTKKGGLRRFHPFLDSQRFILRRLAALELAIHDGRRRDGILVNLLKGSRQIGGSTLAEAVIFHRIVTQNSLHGLIASDVPGEEGSGYLFGMIETMLEHLPWWLRPSLTDHVKNEELRTDGGSQVWVGAGKSMKGARGARGQLGRGKTLHLIHLSELSTWDNPEQIDDALLPTVPDEPVVFAMFESTAKGRNNWWHRHWQHSKTGRASRFHPVFIPWYAEHQHSRFAPVDWMPHETTREVAARIEETGPRWVGAKVRLTRDQLYWYEMKRLSYEEKGNLKEFVEEYGAVDDEECFQHSGRSVVPFEVLQRIREKAKPLAGVAEVRAWAELR